MDNIKIWQELEGMIEEGQSGLRVGCNDIELLIICHCMSKH
ncbi:hypothetical protein [Candidatus Tisiphia endosymbiont of Hybos culiciformis]